MASSYDQEIASRLVAIHQKTGELPIVSPPRSDGLKGWYERNLGWLFSWDTVKTIGRGIRAALDWATEGFVIVSVNMEARRANGAGFQANLTYMTGKLPMSEAKALAESLGGKVIPRAPGVLGDLMERCLSARHDNTPPDVFRITTAPMLGIFPTELSSAQLRGEKPVPPENVKFTIIMTPQAGTAFTTSTSDDTARFALGGVRIS